MANSITPQMDDSKLVSAILMHAAKHYNEDGWDYIVECYSAGDILLLVAECTTVEAAIAKIGGIAKIKGDYRDEIASTAF